MASADPGRTRVHVLTDDERLREAAEALREDRFDVVISSDPAGTVASIRGRGDEVAVLELQLGAYVTNTSTSFRESAKGFPQHIVPGGESQPLSRRGSSMRKSC
ncbi:MAG: hypothetical protein ACRDJ4_14185, partial [Actinomycetota bacterium]